MARKSHPEKVIPGKVKIAISQSKDRQSAFSEYIRVMWQNTGNLSPRCDAKDFYAYYDLELKKK